MTGLWHDKQVFLFCTFALLIFAFVATGIKYASIDNQIINDPDLGVRMLFNGLKFPSSEAFAGSNNGLILEKNNETVQRIVNNSSATASLIDVNVISSSNTEKCNCVVFRLDDVQDNDLNRTQLALMKVFLDKHQKLSLGLIMHFIGNNTSLVNKLNEGVHRNLFELAIHGWNHVDYSKLVEKEQHDSLLKASKKMQNIFGIPSKIFIPPYNDFDSFTLQALNNMSFKIISSMVRNEAEQDIFNSTKDRLASGAPFMYHVPETAQF